MSKYSVNLGYKRPNGNGGNKWFTVDASSSSEAKNVALAQARSQNSDWQWSVRGEPRKLS